MLMKAAKFSKQKCYFLTFFCPTEWWHINWFSYMQKSTRAVPGKQKALIIELVVDNSKVVVKLNIANQRKKLWLLAGIGSGQKEVLMAQRNQRFFLNTWNLDLRETMFVKVALREAKEDVDKVCIEVQKTFDNAGGKPTRDSSLQHKTFSALNYAQDFGTTVKESLKRSRNSKWPTLTKSRIVPCKYFHGFVSSLNCLSHRCNQWEKKMKL